MKPFEISGTSRLWHGCVERGLEASRNVKSSTLNCKLNSKLFASTLNHSSLVFIIIVRVIQFSCQRLISVVILTLIAIIIAIVTVAFYGVFLVLSCLVVAQQ